MKKNLDLSFFALNDGAHYADKNEPKQPQVHIKNFGIAANSSFHQKHQNFRWLGEPPIINIYQKYCTHGVFIVHGVFWKGSP